MDINGMQDLSVECKSMSLPMECMMRNYLEGWRAVSRESTVLTATAWRFKKLMFLATKQINCYELILKQRKILNDKLIKCITNVDNISGARVTKCYALNSEWQKQLQQLVYSKCGMGERTSSLVKTKLELHCMRQKLQEQELKTSWVAMRLKQNTLIAEKLLERNNILNEQSSELLELYRTRTLTFIYKLMDMAEELTAIKSRSKAITDASAQLKYQNDEMQMNQRMLHKKLSMHALQAESLKPSDVVTRNVWDLAVHYMGCLWACVSCLGHCPKLEGTGHRCQWTLVLI